MLPPDSRVPKESGFGVPKSHNPKDVYCCYCADRHEEKDCKYGGLGVGNKRYKQYE